MVQGSRVALVTGANRGIGKQIARQLGAAGLTVLVGARDSDRGAATVAELNAEGLDTRLLVMDVTEAECVAMAAKQVHEWFGVLDVLVNNAGIVAGHAAASQVSVEELRRTYETNVFGTAVVTSAFLPLLRHSESPRVVNVSSALGSITKLGDPRWRWAGVNAAAYQSSKAALNALTALLAKELHADGFKVNAVDPGYRDTELGGRRGGLGPGAGDPAGGAAVATRMALLDENGPTGEFHSADDGVLPW